METALLVIFLLLLLLIFLYSLSQLHLLFIYMGRAKKPVANEVLDLSNPAELPLVTIQLPIYNEGTVVERLLRKVAQLEYPVDKLDIQVLDDSTDDSVILIERLVSELQQEGLNIFHLRRKDRSGFKAGALKKGLKTAKGEFIAVFDADFLPSEDWLLQTIPHFKDLKTGVVQTRWGHLNRNFSLLTRVQAFALDFHFILEQNARNYGGHFINFNGTAGIWRKQCILEAGNWAGDTLTEDLDLSYRAQMKNWKFKYLDHIESPAELPITIEAARSQQFRWNKGAAENFQKNFREIRSHRSLPLITKIHSFFHLLNSSLFLLVLCLALLSVPVLFLLSQPEFAFYLRLMSFFGVSTIVFFLCYWFTFERIHGKGWRVFLEYIGMFFTFFSIAMGFSVHNSKAVLEGHLGRKSAFIRTPKFNNLGKKNGPQGSPSPFHLSLQLLIEIFMMLYFGFAIIAAFYLRNFGFLLFHLMLFFGFAFVVYESIVPAFASRYKISDVETGSTN